MSSLQDKSDESLIIEAQNAALADHRAFEELVKRHRGKILANCIHLTRSADAEDLAQEVFVKVCFALKKFQHRSSVRSWLQRIKVNHCLNYRRRQKAEKLVDFPAESDELLQEVHTDAVEGANIDRTVKKQKIEAILNRMPDTLRIPLILCDMDGLSYQEGADSLNIGLSAFKMRLKRGRECFRKEYGIR